MNLKSFCMQAVFGIKIKPGTYGCKELHPSLTSCCDSCLYLTVNAQKGRKGHKPWLSPSLKYCVTPHHFSMLLFGFLKCPIVSGWFILYE